METSATKYIRLRRSLPFSVLRIPSVWLGQDHLLFITSGSFSEEYRRFYFRDIQQIRLVQTRRATWLSLFWALVTGLFGLLAVLVPTGRIPLAISAAVPFLFLLLNLWWGPCCRCELRTAAHIMPIKCINRWRPALKILARVRPLIESAQGGAVALTEPE